MDSTHNSTLKLPNLQANPKRLCAMLGIDVEQRGHRRWAFRKKIEGTRYHRPVAGVRIKLVGDANELTWYPITCVLPRRRPRPFPWS